MYAAKVANTVVGNAPGDSLVEVTASSFALVAQSRVLVAVTGAADRMLVNGFPLPTWEPLVLEPGQRLAIAAPSVGLRSYVAVNGSVHADRVLGSTSPDPLLGIGRTLRRGDVLSVESALGVVDQPHFGLPLFRLGAVRGALSDHLVIDVTRGPDADEFDATLEERLTCPFTVSAQSNSVGLRLAGAVPRRIVQSEILSRGVPLGAIEIPPLGGLLALLRGRPVTAGYPVVAVATTLARDLLGQARPGGTIAFRPVDMTDAISGVRQREHLLHELAARVGAVFHSLGLDDAVAAGHLSRTP